MLRLLKFGFCLLFGLWLAAPASSQIFKIEGGTSTLFDSDGGNISVKAPNYDGNIGAGIYQGHFLMGAVARTKVMGYTVIGGDDTVRFDLPTDIFGNTSYFSARGVGISKEFENSGFYMLGGLTSQWMGSGFFQAARSEDPTGAFFYSRNVFSRKSTSLQALEWEPEKWLKTSATAGIGSGKPYMAVAVDAELQQLTLRGSYAYVNPDFRRVTIPSLENSEPERENLEATYHFNRDDSITAAHRNLLQPLTLGGSFTRASMDQIGGNFKVGKTYFGSSLYTSRYSGQDSWGTNLFVGQKLTRFLDVTGNYFASRSGSNKTESMVTGTFRETLSPRFNLLQVLTYAGGQWALAYGGEFITNRISARVDYQTQYLAFRTDKPFQQTLSLNASVRVIGSLALSATSSVAPDGHTRYSFGGTTYLYRYGGLFPGMGQSGDSYKFPKYIVQGIVKDQEGKAIAGAALQIGNDIIFTDGEGRFLFRSKKHKELQFAIVPSQFLSTGFFEAVQAPASVTTEKEDQAQEIIVIMRRLTPQEAKLSPIAKADYQKYEPKLPGHEQ
jgi:hypothetical protein